MTGPNQPLTSLTDPDEVQFQWADDLEEGSGYTPQEVDAIFSVPLSAVSPSGSMIAAADATESLYANPNEGSSTVPWKIQRGAGCPDGKPYAVVKESDGSIAGCHPTHAAAAGQLRALYANEKNMAVEDVDLMADDIKVFGVDDPGFITLSNEAYGSDRGLRNYWTHGEGAVKIRWGTPGDFNRCVRHLAKYVRDPKGLCNEYHVEAVGAPPGKGHPGGHSVETSFEVRPTAAPVRRVGAPADVAPQLNPLTVEWEGVLAIEGEETGDGREFAPGSLVWPEMPIPLMYQYITSHGGQTDESTNVGNITEAWRDGPRIMGRGTIDLATDHGIEAARKMKGKFLRGVSIDADSVKNDDIELVFKEPDPSLSEEEQLVQLLSGPPTPEKTIFHNGRIRGATLVNLPAFVGASLDLVGDTSILDDANALAFGLFRHRRGKFDPGAHPHDPVTGRWAPVDGPGGDTSKPEPGSTRALKPRSATSPADSVRKGLTEGRNTIGDQQRRRTVGQGGYDVEDVEALGLEMRVITAAATSTRRGYTIEIPELPPIEFFQEPTELPPIGAVWIEANGHISGLVGPSGVAHRAFKNKRVTIPMGNVDYTAWMNRPTLVEGPNGEVLKIRTGVLTMNCGHMSPYGSDDPQERMKHYDNSCSVAAVVRVGESKKHKAPWVAGMIMPMSTADFLRFQACQLSGDWAPHRERRGWKEFVASLAVPVPGFARSTDVSAVRVDDNAVVVASAVPIRLADDTYTEDLVVDDPMSREALARIRTQLGLGNRQALADIRSRLTTETTVVTAAAVTATPTKEKKTVGCTPCAAKRQGNGQTSAQVPTSPVEGYGTADAQATAQQSAQNSIANTRSTSRG